MFPASYQTTAPSNNAEEPVWWTSLHWQDAKKQLHSDNAAAEPVQSMPDVGSEYSFLAAKHSHVAEPWESTDHPSGEQRLRYRESLRQRGQQAIERSHCQQELQCQQALQRARFQQTVQLQQAIQQAQVQQHPNWQLGRVQSSWSQSLPATRATVPEESARFVPPCGPPSWDAIGHHQREDFDPLESECGQHCRLDSGLLEAIGGRISCASSVKRLESSASPAQRAPPGLEGQDAPSLRARLQMNGAQALRQSFVTKLDLANEIESASTSEGGSGSSRAARDEQTEDEPSSGSRTPENSGQTWQRYLDPASAKHWWYQSDSDFFFEEDAACVCRSECGTWRRFKDTERYWWWNEEKQESFYEPYEEAASRDAV